MVKTQKVGGWEPNINLDMDKFMFDLLKVQNKYQRAAYYDIMQIPHWNEVYNLMSGVSYL